MAIATLTVDINAKLAGIRATSASIETCRAKRQTHGKRIRWSRQRALKTAFTGFAATLTAGFLSDIVQQVVDAQDALSDLNKSTAISVETLSGLAFAAKTTGGDLTASPRRSTSCRSTSAKDPRSTGNSASMPRMAMRAFKQLADIFVAIEDRKLARLSLPKRLAKHGQDPRQDSPRVARALMLFVRRARRYLVLRRNRSRAPAELNANSTFSRLGPVVRQLS